MHRTYEGTLTGNQIDWRGEAPMSTQAIRVFVTVVDDAVADESQGHRMAAALERLAGSGAFAEVDDPAAWQRDVRTERQLPGRETE